MSLPSPLSASPGLRRIAGDDTVLEREPLEGLARDGELFHS